MLLLWVFNVFVIQWAKMDISRRNFLSFVCSATRHMDKILAKMDKPGYPEAMWQGYRHWRNQWHMGVKLMKIFLAVCFSNPTQWAKFKISANGATTWHWFTCKYWWDTEG